MILMEADISFSSVVTLRQSVSLRGATLTFQISSSLGCPLRARTAVFLSAHPTSRSTSCGWPAPPDQPNTEAFSVSFCRCSCIDRHSSASPGPGSFGKFEAIRVTPGHSSRPGITWREAPTGFLSEGDGSFGKDTCKNP